MRLSQRGKGRTRPDVALNDETLKAFAGRGKPTIHKRGIMPDTTGLDPQMAEPSGRRNPTEFFRGIVVYAEVQGVGILEEWNIKGRCPRVVFVLDLDVECK